RLLHRAPHRRDLPPFPTRRSSDLRREGFPGQVIREKQAADRDWLSGAVVNLEPIAAAGRVGHPFVDRETCHGAEARGAVEPSRGWHVERPGAGPVGETADREIRRLHAET